MDRNQPEVVVGLSGGLGNQLFQYATGRALSLRRGVPLILDTSWFSARQSRRYALDHFAVVATRVCAGGDHGYQQNKWMALAERIARRFAVRRMGAPVFRERYFHFDPSVSGLSAPVYLDGYWQSERYFSEIRDVLVNDFSLRSPMGLQSSEMLKQISESDAICVHVRRGDYVTNPVASAVHGLCQLDYYYQGVKFVLDGMTNPHCFVFSDDPDWVRANLELPVARTIVDFNAEDMAHEDLLLMAACKRFVIANSSFSWWGAWLCTSPNKRVVVPKQWFLNDDKDTRDLIPEDWVRL